MSCDKLGNLVRLNREKYQRSIRVYLRFVGHENVVLEFPKDDLIGRVLTGIVMRRH